MCARLWMCVVKLGGKIRGCSIYICQCVYVLLLFLRRNLWISTAHWARYRLNMVYGGFFTGIVQVFANTVKPHTFMIVDEETRSCAGRHCRGPCATWTSRSSRESFRESLANSLLRSNSANISAPQNVKRNQKQLVKMLKPTYIYIYILLTMPTVAMSDVCCTTRVGVLIALQPRIIRFDGARKTGSNRGVWINPKERTRKLPEIKRTKNVNTPGTTCTQCTYIYKCVCWSSGFRLDGISKLNFP